MRRLLAVLGLLATFTCAPGRRPNVLLVTVDTLRADHVGAYGATGASTPALDALAARGLLVERAFTAVPVTLAAHATLLTGRWPPQHGVRGNSFYRLPDRETTMAELLRAAGYRTAAVVGAAVLDHRFGLDQGFELYDDRTTSQAGTVLIAERDASAVVSRALAWLGEPSDRPFFLWVHLFDPHEPYRPPEPFATRFAGAPYDGEVAFVDEQVGRLLAALEAAGKLGATLTVVTADHGESLGEHGEATHGVFLYDSTLRVPLMLAGPGIARERRANVEPASLVDVMPTLLGRLGIAFPPHLAGRDLLARGSAPREFVYAETFLPRDFYDWSELRALRSSRAKFIDGPVPELYDLTRDAAELQDVASTHADEVRSLSAAIDRLATPDPGVAPDAAARTAIAAELGEQLRTLGYASGGPPAAAGAPAGVRGNPKRLIHIVARMDEVLALVRSGRLTDAVTRLQAILAEDPTNFLALRTLGDALFDLGRDREGIVAYQRAIARGRDDAYFHYRLGRLYERVGDYAKAAGEFRLLVRMDGSAAVEILQRADALLKAGETSGALAYVDAIRAEGRGSTAADVAFATIKIALGEPRAALEALDAALQRAPQDDGLRVAKARAMTAVAADRGDSGDLHGAVALLRSASALAPEEFETLANLGITEARLGDDERAVQAFERALAIKPDEVRILNLCGRIAYRRGERGKAASYFRRSLAVEPSQPQVAALLRSLETVRESPR